jgi:hypothetical protein
MQKPDLKSLIFLGVVLGLGVIGVLFYFPDKTPDATSTDAPRSAARSALDPGGDAPDPSAPVTDIDASSTAQRATPVPQSPSDFADFAIDDNGLGADMPLQIGPWIDADDPYAFDPDADLIEPIHIGEPLDADDFSTVTASTTPGPRRSIGPVIDADAPFDQIDDAVEEPAIEIGPALDVDDPASINDATLGLPAPFPLNIGEPLDADAGRF